MRAKALRHRLCTGSENFALDNQRKCWCRGGREMLKITDANNFRRTLAGLCLIAAPLVGLIGALITPQFTGDIGEELATISDQPVLWLIGNFLTLITFLLLT